MMRTSATGARARAEQGFTLIEVMVVVLILGLMAGAVVLTLPDGAPSVATEAERLAARLNRAREEAVLTNRSLDVAVGSEGYEVRALVGGDWRPLREGPFRPFAWEGPLTVRLDSVDGRASVRFDPTGGAGPAEIVLIRDRERSVVAVDEAGEVRIDAPAG